MIKIYPAEGVGAHFRSVEALSTEVEAVRNIAETAAGGGVEEAPVDGGTYGRKNSAWSVLDTTKLTNLIPINNEADFETQDATTITLDPIKSYQLGASFSHSKTIIGSGSQLIGLGSATVLTYTGVDAQFRTTNARMKVSNVFCDAPNATVFDCIGDDTGNPNHRFNVDSVVILNCDKILNSVGCGAQVFEVMQASNMTGTTALSFAGTSPALVYSFDRINVLGMTAGSTVFDFGTAVMQEVELSNIIVSGDSTATAISGLPNSGNIVSGNKATVTGSNFKALDNPLNGVVFDDIRWNFHDTPRVRETRNAADCFLNAPQVVTIGGGNSNVFFNIGGANWGFTVDHRFTISSAGVITYVGEDVIDVKVSCSITLEKVGGGSDNLEAQVGLNGVNLPRSAADSENNKPTSIPLECFVTVENGDEITLMVANTTGSSDINVVHCSILISS